MKQTSVEWLFLMMNNPNSNQDFANKLFEQAKEMEKQQIINAVYHHCSAMSHSDLPCGEQYYNETFKQE